jgi:hypothetical protein
MSAMRSSTSSSPTLIRIRLGVRPLWRRSSSDSGEVDISQGFLTSDSAPPSDSASVKSLQAAMNLAPDQAGARVSPRTPGDHRRIKRGRTSLVRALDSKAEDASEREAQRLPAVALLEVLADLK